MRLLMYSLVRDTSLAFLLHLHYHQACYNFKNTKRFHWPLICKVLFRHHASSAEVVIEEPTPQLVWDIGDMSLWCAMKRRWLHDEEMAGWLGMCEEEMDGWLGMCEEEMVGSEVVLARVLLPQWNNRNKKNVIKI